MSRPDSYSSPKDPLALELLVTQDERRSTDLPEARRDNMPELVHTLDTIDYEVSGDPAAESPPRRVSSKKTASLFAILDELQEEGCSNE